MVLFATFKPWEIKRVAEVHSALFPCKHIDGASYSAAGFLLPIGLPIK
jgi:hypothetical protein